MSRLISRLVERLFAAGLMAIAASTAMAQAPVVWKPSGIGGGGALFAPTFSPYSSNELSLFCDMGEQFRTSNAGASWTVTPFNALVSSGTTEHIQYGASDQALYAISYANDGQTPVSSHDGGRSWHALPNDPTFGNPITFIVDRQNPELMLLADYTYLYSSINGGVSWRVVDVDYSGNGLVFAGAAFTSRGEIVCDQHALLVSTDGGNTFQRMPIGGMLPTEGIVQFACGQSSNGSVRMVAVTNPVGSFSPGVGGDSYSNFENVYALQWGQPSWTQVTGHLPTGTMPFFVGMADNDSNTAYLAGCNEAGMHAVVKSTDGGITWRSVFEAVGNVNIVTGWSGWEGDHGWWYGGNALGFEVSPADSTKVAITDYGFCHVSTNGGATWRQVYESPKTENAAGENTPTGQAYATNGLEDTSCWTISWLDSAHMWAGYSDICAVRSTNSGQTWSFNYSGINTNCVYQFVVSPSGAIYAATSSIHDMYESTRLTDSIINPGGGQVVASTDGGQTWTAVGSIGHVVVGVAIDPNDSKRLYASVSNSSSGGIYRCDDATQGASSTWTQLAAPPRTQGHADSIVVLKDGTLVCSYSGRRTSNFTASSGVFASSDGGETWSDLSDPNMDWWTRDLVIDPTDPTQKTWYAGVYSGWGGAANNRGGLYRSTNRGQSWTNILPLVRVGSCTVNPANGNQVFAATETQGLWFTSDVTAGTPVFTQQQAYPFGHPQRMFFNPYKAGEVWVSSFGNGIRVGEMVPSAG